MACDTTVATGRAAVGAEQVQHRKISGTSQGCSKPVPAPRLLVLGASMLLWGSCLAVSLCKVPKVILLVTSMGTICHDAAASPCSSRAILRLWRWSLYLRCPRCITKPCSSEAGLLVCLQWLLLPVWARQRCGQAGLRLWE